MVFVSCFIIHCHVVPIWWGVRHLPLCNRGVVDSTHVKPLVIDIQHLVEVWHRADLDLRWVCAGLFHDGQGAEDNGSVAEHKHREDREHGNPQDAEGDESHHAGCCGLPLVATTDGKVGILDDQRNLGAAGFLWCGHHHRNHRRLRQVADESGCLRLLFIDPGREPLVEGLCTLGQRLEQSLLHRLLLGRGARCRSGHLLIPHLTRQ
mmetsp:Transcript_11115/g.19943  ORF Transcript_11115/g.19943 Transcript_11115/m.19943 type:complete len:207 (-) Transcript_11115:40-660(-)